MPDDSYISQPDPEPPIEGFALHITLHEARRIARLRDPENFYRRYVQLLPTHDTPKEAYKATEREYFILWRERKYASYRNFQIAHCDRRKRKNSENVNDH